MGTPLSERKREIARTTKSQPAQRGEAKPLPLVGKPYVEMIAVMAKYNPFTEKASQTQRSLTP